MNDDPFTIRLAGDEKYLLAVDDKERGLVVKVSILLASLPYIETISRPK